MKRNRPIYLRTFQDGLLREKIQQLRSSLSACNLCPRNCGVDRLNGETGICNTGEKARVSSYTPHFGEERPLVGTRGSGTIFFTYCNLLCKFCQNYDISHQGRGEEVTDTELADMMLYLQDIGCHNINFVTPSHVVTQILSALEIAILKGLRIPLVYNTGGYDNLSTIKILNGVIDIYMPDFKFWSAEVAKKYCRAKDYPEMIRLVIKEMYNQVGDLIINDGGIAVRGILIRHLVMPNGLAGTREVMRFIAQNLSINTYVNIMAQYRPCGEAYSDKNISRTITMKEYYAAIQMAKEEGITRLD
jgi:putative pyruvate formate lyase activating enzyme